MNDQEKEIWRELLADERRSSWMRFEGEARWGLDTYFSTIMKGIEHLHAWIVRRKTRGKTMNEGKEKVPRQTLGTRAYPEPGIVVQEGSTAVQ